MSDIGSPDFSYLGQTDYSDTGTYYDPTSISTVDPNPSNAPIYSPGSSSGTDWSGILQSAGQYGTAIASIVTGKPVAVNPTTGQTVGVAGSTTVIPSTALGTSLSGSSGIFLLLIVAVVAILLIRKEE